MHNTSTGHVGRFAPTPSGELHLGTLVAALGSWLRARQQDGQWLVRIDDIDPPREVPGSGERILKALERCGLQADRPPLYQSSRHAAYAQALQSLDARGLVFECWCSRQDLAGSIHRDGHCVRTPDPARAPALRLRTPPGDITFQDLLCGPVRQDVRQRVGDFVLRRADGCWSYHLACAVDEAHMGITEVIRGRDLLPSTARQILLMRLLDLPVPVYGHLPLVLGADGSKLSKSDHNASLDLSDPAASVARALVHLGCKPSPAATGNTALLLDQAIDLVHFIAPQSTPHPVASDDSGA